jgi:hypothetical protein
VIFLGYACGTMGAALFGWLTNSWLALGVLSIAVFSFACAVAVGPIVIQGLAVSRVRGQSIAVYILIVNIFGLGLGPTLIAGCSDYLLREERSVGRAVGIVAMLVMPVSLYLLHVARMRLKQRAGSSPASRGG